MLAKVWTAAAAALVAGALVLPAPAAYAQGSTAPAAKPLTMKKPMAKKTAHHNNCYDYAWESAAMQDCLAKGTSKASTSKPTKKKKVTTS